MTETKMIFFSKMINPSGFNSKQNLAFSEVIGVILTVAIIVGISTIVYTYANQSTEDLGHSFTSFVSMSVFPSNDVSTSAIINIDKSIEQDVFWDEMTWTLADITEGKELVDGTHVNVNLPALSSIITNGQIISITTADGNYLKDGNEYQFTIYYGENFVLLGIARWRQ